jgi:asparagine synthase (glutamine-hydrolysing)
MCGIWALIGSSSALDPDVLKTCLQTLNARGPEMARVVYKPSCTLGFTRLAINGLNEGGMQPFETDTLLWMCNGEIYNAKQLAAEYNLPMTSGSDCEILGPLYKQFRDQNNLAGFFQSLDGVFAIVLYDKERGEVVWGRDPYGVRPLFAAWNVEGVEPSEMILNDIGDFSGLTVRLVLNSATMTGLCLTSERKALPPGWWAGMQFSPGFYGSVNVNTLGNFNMQQYHSTPWLKNPSYSPAHPNGYELAKQGLRCALEEAVRKRLMTERPIAALLSGGIDSSLIAALVQKSLRDLNLPPLKTFSIGMPGSTDLAFARKVADHIGSDHTEVILNADDFFNAIPKVIYDIESYDITSVRASVGNWLVSKAIREACDCKVVFNGDGSDEVFGSYLYFFRAPSDQAFETEVERLLKEICYYDVLRSDRSISLHGLEPRTPFLDKQFVSVAKSIATSWRRPIQGSRVEKCILRDAFDGTGLLPDEVLWRQKEAFSDGVSSKEKSWYQEIQDRVESIVGPDWKFKAIEYAHCTPLTPEAFYYRTVYESHYGPYTAQTAIPAFWMPRWSPETTDPSARTLKVYRS